MKRVALLAALCVAGLSAALLWDISHPVETEATAGSEIEILRGLEVTYLATPALFDELGVHPRRDFGVATNGNVFMNADEGVLEIEVRGGTMAVERLSDTPLDAMALDGGTVTLGISGRFFGQLGPGGFQQGIPLPKGRMRLAASTRPGWVYMFRNAPEGGRLYGVWDNGTLSTLAEFPGPILAVADDPRTTFVATRDGLLALDQDKIRVISKTTADFDSVHALAAGPGRLFLAARDRVYVLADGMLLAVAKGLTPEMTLVGDRLYCWDAKRRLLLALEVGPLFET